MSIHPAFDQPTPLFACAPIWGRKWLVFYDFALAPHSACSQFLRAPMPTPMLRATAPMFRTGRSLGTKRWLSRLASLLGSVKTFSGLLIFALYPILATSQDLSVHDQVAVHAQKAQQFLRANQPDRAIPEFRSILAVEP